MATVAQLVEHLVVVRVVAGSSPVGRPILSFIHIHLHSYMNVKPLSKKGFIFIYDFSRSRQFIYNRKIWGHNWGIFVIAKNEMPPNVTDKHQM